MDLDSGWGFGVFFRAWSDLDACIHGAEALPKSRAGHIIGISGFVRGSVAIHDGLRGLHGGR
jgi:hypothetical protein